MPSYQLAEVGRLIARIHVKRSLKDVALAAQRIAEFQIRWIVPEDLKLDDQE